jgi:hydrogenase maturation protein HypF
MQILIRGIVQGVGFRPFVYGMATQRQLTGWVCNSSRGVEIEVNGPEPAVEDFVRALQDSPPPLARIDTFTTRAIPFDGYAKFAIQESVPQPGEFIPISPDVSICSDCARELFDPADRRYRYPFINCTNCGPRFSIIRDIPYDRPNTTMAGFPLCDPCRAEYEDPLDRRFHAQPVACPQCGPQVWFEVNGEILAHREGAIQAARQFLKEGNILAIKGLGGYHLACDATNPQTVAELHLRKRRVEKPFALMAWDAPTIERYCQVSPAETDLLLSRQRPIVLLERREGTAVAPQVAPGQTSLGLMLPYTPLHLLLLEPDIGYPDLWVMTSGNLSEEPIAYQDEDARQRLAPLADGFLLHDRPIHMRVDDSVMRVMSGKTVSVRRSRGYAPDPLRLPFAMSPILGAGAELKNTFCLTRQDYAFVSHHIGDLENYETLQSYEKGIQHFEKLFRITPERVGCDMHPNYLSTAYAHERASREGIPLVEVQHHHAHLAACLADNAWPGAEPAIGLIFDGTGYGTDGTIWGGEVLVGGYTGFNRRFHLALLPLPGGDAAVRKPGRTALAALWKSGIDWDPALPPVDGLCAEERSVLRAQLEKGINTPLTSSMGRLFDTVSALIGVRQKVNYEGQAAMELEALANPAETGYYEFSIAAREIDPQPVFSAIIADWLTGVAQGRISARFHNGLVRLCADLCEQVRAETGIRTVAIAGGVWQNRFLFEHTLPILRERGFDVLTHQQLPANDGSICVGQAVIAGFQSQPDNH